MPPSANRRGRMDSPESKRYPPRSQQSRAPIAYRIKIFRCITNLVSCSRVSDNTHTPMMSVIERNNSPFIAGIVSTFGTNESTARHPSPMNKKRESNRENIRRISTLSGNHIQRMARMSFLRSIANLENATMNEESAISIVA